MKISNEKLKQILLLLIILQYVMEIAQAKPSQLNKMLDEFITISQILNVVDNIMSKNNPTDLDSTKD